MTAGRVESDLMVCYSFEYWNTPTIYLSNQIVSGG